MYDFHKNFFFSKRNIWFKYISASPFKKFNSVKKNPPCKKKHSGKHEFYFQFSFATNEQVYMIVKIYKYFFEILLL